MDERGRSLEHKRLLELVSYCPDTGVFRRLKRSAESGSHKIVPGQVAGGVGSHGYYYLRVDGHQYKAHRLAWFYVHGEWPTLLIDHLNGVKTDNRIANLRQATDEMNAQNILKARGKSGYLGVSSRAGRYVARLMLRGKLLHLGTFDSAEEAYRQYVLTKRQIHAGCTLSLPPPSPTASRAPARVLPGEGA